jgi:tetrapyrrole methylase family protein / MazG family protein
MSEVSTVEAKFGKLVDIMKQLRGPNGCPWDKEQTHQSLRQYLLEEAHEVLELIDQQRYDDMRLELGDLLLQIIFHCQIADEDGRFSIADILDNINHKLISRHPNVFGNVNIRTADEQTINWERIKMTEGKKSVIDGVPRELPALLRAHRTQAKAATVGFDWEKADDVWKKVHEEFNELKHAVEHESDDAVEAEFGDLLFALVNLSRFIKVNPEDALRRAIGKFARRFQFVEQEIQRSGRSMSDCTLAELDAVWDEAKRREHDPV